VRHLDKRSTAIGTFVQPALYDGVTRKQAGKIVFLKESCLGEAKALLEEIQIVSGV
jgi:hypothetical protein